MKNSMIWWLVLGALFCISCGDNSDEELLALDQKTLRESIKTDKVYAYKFGKIIMRSSASDSTLSPEYAIVKDDIDKLFEESMNIQNGNREDISAQEALEIYKEYKRMQEFVETTDEDVFPTLSDAFNAIHGDSIQRAKPFQTGKDKEIVESTEHALLSAIFSSGRDFVKDISMYECAETNPDVLPDSEAKALLHYLRGSLFFEKQLYYLSENAYTQNIQWLNDNPDVELVLTSAFLKLPKYSPREVHIAFHGMNHIIRGVVRLKMEREIDHERALGDFEAFVDDAEKIGLENELVWVSQAYVYLHNGENEKAITALRKLQKSNILTRNEKDAIGESIKYLENREPDKALNGVYDQAFLAKITAKYLLAQLAEIDWEQELKKQNVPYTDELFRTINRLNNFIEKMENYTSTDRLREASEEAKEKGKDLWNEAKEIAE